MHGSMLNTFIVSRAVDLSPMVLMESGFGPMKLMPWSLQISTKPAFSDRNPYPCMNQQNIGLPAKLGLRTDLGVSQTIGRTCYSGCCLPKSKQA